MIINETIITLGCVALLASFVAHAQWDSVQIALRDMLLFEAELSAASWKTAAARDDQRAVKGHQRVETE